MSKLPDYLITRYCQSWGGSDYCQFCGGGMCSSDGKPIPCPEREASRLRNIPDAEIVAFGCSLESSTDQIYADAGLANDDPWHCEKWCHRSNCPFTLKEPADELVL